MYRSVVVARYLLDLLLLVVMLIIIDFVRNM